jgi:hypothetical protein
MPYIPPIVAYYDSGTSSWLTMSGVQSINISRGRQRFQDPVSQSSAVIEIIPTASTTFSVGQYVEVKTTNSDNSVCFFQGRITDVDRSYSFPYDAASGETPQDRITISATGAVGVAGARQEEGVTWANIDAGTVIGAITFDQGLVTPVSYSNGVKASSQFYQGPLLDAVNKLLNTAQLTIDDYQIIRFWMVTYNWLGFTYFPTGQQFKTIAFTDTSDTFKFRYTGLQYLSSVQNTFNEVEVTAEGASPQVTRGTAPFNTLSYQTYNETNAAALNLSSYLYNLLSGQTTPVPFTITTDTNAEPRCRDLAEIPASTLTNAIIGQPVTVDFRGTSATGTVIGVNSNFYPDYAQVQLYLSPSLGTPFTLDSASFGVLDQNRLGYP